MHSDLINDKVQYSLSPRVSFALPMSSLMIAFAMCDSGFTELFLKNGIAPWGPRGSSRFVLVLSCYYNALSHPVP